MDRAEWLKAHGGRLTASRFHIAMHGGPRAWNTLITALRAEREQGISSWTDGAVSASTEWGMQYEDEARRAFGFISGLTVQQSGLILSPDLDDVGCSPDGVIVNDRGEPWALLEIKTPYKAEIHAAYRATGLPERYQPQVMGSLWVTGLKTAFFCSYDPRANGARGDLFIHEVQRDDEYVQRLEQKIRRFMEVLQSGEFVREFDPTADEIPNLF